MLQVWNTANGPDCVPWSAKHWVGALFTELLDTGQESKARQTWSISDMYILYSAGIRNFETGDG